MNEGHTDECLMVDNIKVTCRFSSGPYYELMTAIARFDTETFDTVLVNPCIDLMATEYHIHRYDTECRFTILDVCCIVPRAEFLDILLSCGNRLDVNRKNETTKTAPVHLATTTNCIFNWNTIMHLCRHPQTDINLPDGDGNTILHLLVIKCVDDNGKSYSMLSYYEILGLDAINPNLLNDDGVSPACIVATADRSNPIKRLLMELFMQCPKVDFDTVVRGKPLREVVEENCAEMFPVGYLHMRDTRRFISYITSHKFSKKTLENCNESETYLQCACENRLTIVVDYLLRLGVDPNGTGSVNDWCPLYIAARHGYADVMKLLLNRPNLILRDGVEHKETSNMSAIVTTLMRKNVTDSGIERDKKKDLDSSFDLLLAEFSKNPQLDVNYLDGNDFTYLLRAYYVGNLNYVFSLLDHGSNIAFKNCAGKSLLDFIERNTLEVYLNKCIATDMEFDEKEGEIVMIITFSYNFMCPPKMRDQLFDHHHETYPLMCIIQNPNLRPLLLHPVVSCFIDLKWSLIKRYYYINLMFYFMFLFSLNAYIYFTFKPIGSMKEVTHWALWALVLLLLTVFVVRELFQFVLSPCKYLSIKENWFEICIIALTSYLLCEKLTKNTSPLFSSIVVLMTWGELILMLGRHSFFAIAVAMLTVVTKNFLKYLLMYTTLLFAFVLSLFVLFNNAQVGDKYDTSNNQTGQADMFSTLWNTSFKLVVMLSGEIDASSFRFPEENATISQIVVVVCIVFIPIVLANLLNGLAVSDIKEIIDEAEVIGLISKLTFINSFEKNPLSKILEHKTNDNTRRFSFLTRLLRVKFNVFPNVLKDQKLNIRQKFDYSVKISEDVDVKINDKILEKSKSILKLQRDSNDNKIEYLVSSVEQTKNLVSSLEKMDKKINELYLMMNKK